jgi:hypothetical protein
MHAFVGVRIAAENGERKSMPRKCDALLNVETLCLEGNVPAVQTACT